MDFSKLIGMSKDQRIFQKQQSIFRAGSVISCLGVVMQGTIQIEQNDFWGNRTIMDTVETGGIFAETYAVTGEPLMVNVVAVTECKIAFVNVKQILESGNSEEKMLLTQMLLKISSIKNLNFIRKIACTSPKSIRARLTAFLTFQANKNGTNQFTIPFDRQTLADYLNVERSAMSAELGRMRDEGLLETKKNWFKLNIKQ